MELIQIIFNILVFGGGFFILAVLIAFFISKSREPQKNGLSKSDLLPRKLPIQPYESNLVRQKIYWSDERSSQITQTANRTSNIGARIYEIDKLQSRELKIVRKVKTDEAMTIEQLEERLKKVNANRYSIVNDKLKKMNNRAANYYL